MARQRLDVELVRRGLAPSRERAQELITNARVRVNGVTATKSATQVDNAVSITVTEGEVEEFASRGAHKLLGALDHFGISVEGKRCLDAGASTGGFTDVLLRRGATSVIAIDVGYGQLIWRLRQDPRVIVHDRTNVRTLSPDLLGDSVDLAVADLSFISLTLVLEALTGVAGELLVMVKPQFEVGKQDLGSGGVVRDPALRQAAVEKVARRAAELGWQASGVVASPLPGPAGNVEYFLWLTRGQAPLDLAAIAEAIANGP